MPPILERNTAVGRVADMGDSKPWLLGLLLVEVEKMELEPLGRGDETLGQAVAVRTKIYSTIIALSV